MSRNTNRIGLWTVISVVLAALGALICLDVTVYIWSSLAQHQTVWPFPALYLCEAMLLSVGTAIINGTNVPFRATITWISTGALLGFIALAVLTIGSYYIPVVVLMALSGIVQLFQNRRTFTQFVSWSAGGAAVQITLMLGILSVLA